MAGVNRVIIVGRLGREPEFKSTSSGKSITTLNVAVSETWKDESGNKQERTEWIRCTSFGKQAEVLAKYLQKGSQVYIDGKLRTREYEKNGEKRYSTEVTIDSLQFLDSKPSSSSGDKPPYARTAEKNSPGEREEEPFNDDIPF